MRWPAQVQADLRWLREHSRATLLPAARCIAAAVRRADSRYADRITALFDGLPASKGTPTTVLIKPVGDLCNLGCAYCYEAKRAQNHPQSRMSIEEMQHLVARLICADSPVRNIYVHGGEPLLAGLPFFRSLVAAVRDKAAGQTIELGVQTNGVHINADWAAFFKANGFAVGVSLDGDARQNSGRVFRNGLPSYSAVRRGMQYLNDADIEFGVISVTTESAASVPDAPRDLIAHMAQLGVRLLDVHPAATPTGTSGSAAKYNMQPDTFAVYMIALFEAWLELGNPNFRIRSFEDIFQTLGGCQSSICYRSGSCSSIIGVEADGSVSPCTRPFQHHRNFGNLKDNNLIALLADDRHKSFVMAELAGQRRTEACKWKNLCGYGGCPHERFTNAEQDVSGRHLYCRCQPDETGGYPAFFQHVLTRVAEVLREAIGHEIRSRAPA